jgi:hypothetical protein
MPSLNLLLCISGMASVVAAFDLHHVTPNVSNRPLIALPKNKDHLGTFHIRCSSMKMLKKKEYCPTIDTPHSLTSNGSRNDNNISMYRNLNQRSRPKRLRQRKRSFKLVLLPVPVGIGITFLASIDPSFWDMMACLLIVLSPYIALLLICRDCHKNTIKAELQCLAYQVEAKLCILGYEVEAHRGSLTYEMEAEHGRLTNQLDSLKYEMKADLGSFTNEIKKELESLANQLDSLNNEMEVDRLKVSQMKWRWGR